MFDILMYLFETYIHNEIDMCRDHNKLTDDLTKIGFHQEDIYNTLSWLKKLFGLQNAKNKISTLNSNSFSMRIYTKEEFQLLNTMCRGFLLFLEQIKVLNCEAREMIIDFIIALRSEEVSLEDLKWIILIVLFNIPECENAYQQMKNLVFEEGLQYLH